MFGIKTKIKWQVLRTRLYFERLHGRVFVLPLLIFVLFTVAFFSYSNFLPYTDLWDDWAGANGNALHFCERNRTDSIIRQPSNTWSNLGFLVVSLFILTLGINDLKYKDRKKSDNFLVRYPIFTILFGVSCLYTFVGSFMYHASLTRFFQIIDQAGMYAMVIMVLVFNIYKIFPLVWINGGWKSTHGILVAFALLLNYLILTRIMQMNINVFFPMFVIMVFITSVYYLMFVSKEHYFTNYLWAAFATLLLGAVIWILDRTKTVCSPESIFQGHALWHLFTAASALLIYLYYRSGHVPLEYSLALSNERRARRLARRNRA
ncbi:MAG: ceramidase [Chitinophagales bacterium]|nr:ceramidase [Chitinophagales bacterium]MDW8418585.1 ceramidase domain-containing protein [Chitinophagales bacterium]